MSRARAAVLALTLALGPCDRPQSSAPPAGFPYAYATADCAPWDGPAVTITLTTRPTDSIAFAWPQVRVSVWQSETALAGQTFAWPSDRQVGAATRCTSDAECQGAASARVSFAPASQDSTLDGFLELQFSGADSTLRGAFRASWRRMRVMCG